LRAADELQALQDERKVRRASSLVFCVILLVFLSVSNKVALLSLQKVDPKTAEALDQFLLKLRSFAGGNSSFTFILDDPAGNSFVENP